MEEMDDDTLNGLVNYIHQHQLIGTTDAKIRQYLVDVGWTEEWIGRAFAAVKIYHPGDATPFKKHIEKPPPTIPIPNNYQVRRALSDSFEAMSRNGRTFLMAVVISAIVVTVSLILVSLVIGKLHSTLAYYGYLPANTFRFIVFFVGSLLLYTIWYSFVYAFSLSVISLALSDGASGKKTSITDILSKRFDLINRVVSANALFLLVAFWPLVFVVIIPIIWITSHDIGFLTIWLLPILSAMAIAWLNVAALRFALLPYVALFEPHITLSKALTRSRRLLQYGGQWFLVKGFLMIIAVLTLLLLITGSSIKSLNNSNNFFIDGLLIVLAILANGVLVMLYKNRNSVRV